MSRLFGKNGFRAIAVTELTCELAMQIGRAASKVFSTNKKDRGTRIFIGRDIRNSSDVIESALCSGICSAGMDPELLGAVTVPALAWHIKERGAAGGIMITASHAAAEYSGIKLFSADGYWLDDGLEAEIERLILDSPDELMPVRLKKYGTISRYENAAGEYAEHLKTLSLTDLSGIKAVVDCACGSTAFTALNVFSGLGAEIISVDDEPDGYNINSSGSTRIEKLMEAVTKNNCSCGIAFDGSGERCLAVDEKGDLVDGDMIIAACAGYLMERELLKNNTISVNQANNLGLIQFARKNGISVSAAPISEKGLLRRMLESGSGIGGDPAGRILFPDISTTYDGQLTGLRLLEALKSSGKKMSELVGAIEKWPQVMLNVPIEKKFREIWKNDRAITGLIDEFSEILGEDGRIVVREIGAEPVIRIRIEGKDFSVINAMAIQIADTIKERMEETDK